MSAVRVAYATTTPPALDGVALEVAAGEGVALLGANGAGKTTLLRAAMALLPATSGTVSVLGRDTRGRAPEDFADVAGYLFQYPEAQLFERTVRAEVGFGPRQLGWNDDRIRDATAGVLDELELADVADAHPYDLPAPRRRLVALAATLASDPGLLLLDEPSAALDRSARRLVERAVLRRRAGGAAVLAVTHDGAFASEALARAIVLEYGRVVADAPLSDVLGTGTHVPAVPPHVDVSRRLGLAVASLHLEDTARAVAERCRAAR